MRPILALPLLALLFACNTENNNAAITQSNASQTTLESPQQTLATPGSQPFEVTVVADFEEPWAMTFVPGTPYALIQAKPRHDVADACEQHKFQLNYCSSHPLQSAKAPGNQTRYCWKLKA